MEVRPATKQDYEGAMGAIWEFCFREGKPLRRTWEQVLEWADPFVAESNGRVVGAYGNIRYDMSYGDQTIPIGGIAAVGVPLTERRKGVAEEMMRHAVQHNRETGRPAAMLYGFRLGFYRNLGWDLVGRFHNFCLDLSEYRPTGDVDRVREVKAEPNAEIESVYAQFARRYRGVLSRSTETWREKMGSDSEEKRTYAFVYEGDLGPEGYMFFKYEDECWWIDENEDDEDDDLVIREFVALTPTAHRGLLSALKRFYSNQVKRVKWAGPSDDWTLTLPYERCMKIGLWNQPMLRVTDPVKLLQSPSNATGEYTVRIHDGEAQTFHVVLNGGEPKVYPSDATPGLTMKQTEFIRCWVGDPDAQQLRRAGLIEVDDEAQFDLFSSHFPRGVFYTMDFF